MHLRTFALPTSHFYNGFFNNDVRTIFVKLILIINVLCATQAKPGDAPEGALGGAEGPGAPPVKRCLTGYMTDVQAWVNADGTLAKDVTSHNEGIALDLSYTSHALPTLLRYLMSEEKKKRSVSTLSLAGCALQEIPPIFLWSDADNRYLGDTIEYVSFYGNNFDVLISTGQRYDVTMNATSPREVPPGLLKPDKTKSWSTGFTGVEFVKLKELDLRSCKITILEDGTFSRMPNLESLYLGENAIVRIEAKALIGLKSLIHLDLSRNFIHDERGAQKTVAIDSEDLFEDLKLLHSLDFSYTKLSPRYNSVLGSLGSNMQRLSICHSTLGSLRNDALKKTSIAYLDVTGNPGVLSSPKALHGLEGSLKVLYAEHVGLKNMEPFNDFRKLEILKLTNNEIYAIPRHIVEKLDNLQVLDLDRNRMVTWFDRHISGMKNLKFLSVRHNNINMITDEMAVDFANTSYLGLSNNFFICSCNARELFDLAWRNEKSGRSLLLTENGYRSLDKRVNFHIGFQEYNSLIEHRGLLKRSCDDDRSCDTSLELKFRGEMVFFDYDFERYQCLMAADEKNAGFQNYPSCNQKIRDGSADFIRETWNKFLLFIIPALILPALAIIFLFRRNIAYFFITMRNSAMLSLINKNEGQDEGAIFNYDVFVSYCNEDRGWVLDQLLPHVERDCNISVCLHERDFQVGLSILENIVFCMDRSRSIMLIISQRFLLSQWCQFEMHLAQHRLLETRREDLILILLEEIPRRLRPNTLHYLMLTKTYIVWPKTEVEQGQFWRRLRKSLVTHKLKHTENVSLA